ncbi:PAS fold [Tranquillimonas alkanivorans]|uniref:histidine kinase n=2 Tax=Tranquillimonas alkanivorans TaxID=441119 RepID=A0A1I5TLL9_9RHOB|nr:PAS fold [Tranquillimonas alkanivorans]
MLAARAAEAVGLLLVVGLGVVIAGKFEQLRLENHLQGLRLSTTLELTEIREEIEEEVFEKLVALGSLTTLFRSQAEVSETELARFFDELPESYSIAQVLLSREGVVTRAHPSPSGLLRTGHQWVSDPESAEALDRALSSDAPVTSGPVMIPGVQEPLLLLHQAIKPLGIVTLVVPYTAFVRESDLGRTRNLDLLITTDRQISDDRQPVWGQRDVVAQDPIVLDFGFPHGEWQIMGLPKGGWPAHRPGYIADRFIMAAVAAVLLGLFGYVHYLSEANRAARNRLEDGSDALRDGLVMYDASGRLIMTNSQYCRIYDKVTDLIVPGKHFDELNREAATRGQFAAGDTTTALRFEKSITDGAVRDQRLHDGRHIRATDHRMRDGNIVGLRVDVTELEQAREKAEAASRAKSEFMNTLSHELRTPLTVILGYARLWKNIEQMPAARKLSVLVEAEALDRDSLRAGLDELVRAVRHAMEKLDTSGSHLLALITDILDFSKIESGTLALDIQPCSVATIVDPVVDAISTLAAEKGLQFQCRVEAGQVQADPKRCRQILFNLLGNAIKFTEAGKVALVVEERRGQVHFRVTDTGEGIAEENQARIFEAFHQVDSSDSRKAAGTGLGLAISQRFAEAQGGAITVTSRTGEGSTFVLSLPRGQHAVNAARDVESAPSLVG